MFLYKSRKYLIIVVVLMVLNYLHYRTPFGFYSPVLFYTTWGIPFVTFFMLLKYSANQFACFINLMIWLCFLALIAYSWLGGGGMFSSIDDTNCGSDIKVGSIHTGFVGSQAAILKSHLGGLYYTLNDISSDRYISFRGKINDANYSSSFNYYKTNFYNPTDYEKYRDCLPNVAKICKTYFDIGRSPANYPCKD
jgi:hypothetical protein